MLIINFLVVFEFNFCKNMFLLIDNYDSFTYNLFHLIKEVANEKIDVVRNDKITLDEILKRKYKAIFISPGPCTPNESGVSIDVLQKMHEFMPIFGVCLGFQAIAQVFGGKVVEANLPMHGKVSVIENLQNSHIFSGIPKQFNATRYHSLIAKDLPSDLIITAKSSDDGHIMAISHAKFNVHGVQFHPESISSEFGKNMIENFLSKI